MTCWTGTAMSDRDRFDIIRRTTERERNRHARHAYRERQRKCSWQDATRMLAEAFDRDHAAKVR